VATSRKTAEQVFFDAAYRQQELDSLNGFYVESAGVRDYERRIYEATPGKRVLEYGCGIGSYAIRLADRGASVCGIDISNEAIDRARKMAEGRAEFRVADAENLDMADASIDVVCGTGILHHLDIDRAIREVRRVLRPGGRAIFYEPVAHNPIVSLYRILTPSKHTRDEHPLRMRDIRNITSHFSGAEVKFFDVLSIGAIPLLSLPGGKPLLRALEWADRRLLDHVAIARPMAATVVVDASG
jgi:ubiquinone/menaquinone biosynthesis C-methylase UbiE